METLTPEYSDQLEEQQEKHSKIHTQLKLELNELSKQLCLKEERCQQYAKNNVVTSDEFKQSLALKIQYEKQISLLEKEKHDLMNSIKLLQASNKDADAKVMDSE